MNWVGLLVLSFCISVLGTFLYRRYAKQAAILDYPSDRGSHTKATPRGGGVVFVVIILVGNGLLYAAGQVTGPGVTSVLIAGSVAAVGFWDDRRSLSSLSRLAVHFIAIGAILAIGGATIPASVTLYAIGIIALFAGVWSVNLYNFMDGSDGIATAQALFVSAVVGYGANVYALPDGVALSVLVCGALCGFLVFNWPPARLFMGDAGSGFLGALVVIYAMVMAQVGLDGMLVIISATAVFAIDATCTLALRVARGHSPTKPHRSHIYQRMARHFGSHRAPLLSYGAVNLGIVLPVCLLQLHSPGPHWGTTLGLYAALAAAYYAVHRALPE